MTDTQYILAKTPEDFERERLNLLSDGSDPTTFRRLREAGITSGWRCLEVGAGNGSVANFLAQQVGPEGHVVATDIRTNLLDGLSDTIELRVHDISTDELERGAFDLIHCRALLAHVNPVEPVLRKLVSALKPGGTLVAEEADYSSMRAVDSEHPGSEAFERTMRETAVAFRNQGRMDLFLGRQLPRLLRKAGLQNIRHEGTTHIINGGGPEAKFMTMNMEVCGDDLIAAGAFSRNDLEATVAALADPDFAFVDGIVFGVTAQATDNSSR